MRNLFDHISTWFNAPRRIDALVMFRVFFGVLMLLESWGAIITGWVSETFVEPSFTFHFWGFQWTQFLLTDVIWSGDVVYVWFFLMGLMGLAVALGYRYRWSSIGLFIFWSTVYFAQKSHYNNHYYLVMLLSLIFVFVPAAGQYSLDLKHKRVEAISFVPGYYVLVFPLLVGIVYFYATIAKIHPDWLNGIPLLQWLQAKSNYPVIGTLLAQDWMAYFFSYGGIFFDGFIILLLLNRKTLWAAIILSLFFHIMNSIVFQIGIFPYLALSFAVFFFPQKEVHGVLKRWGSSIKGKRCRDIPVMRYAMLTFLIVQFILPLRHHLIPGDVLWTEEGHRCSWRMMLRAKSARTVIILTTDEGVERLKPRNLVDRHQVADVSWKPDLILMMAHRIGHEALNKGRCDVSVRVDAQVSVNQRPRAALIDPDINLLEERWNYFGHQRWLLLAPWAL